ncbi:MAG: hypothetical protein IPJ34_43990 [Myxococcales bacterium]|nr:hypothetical protein [Myxococcales bacterium]
MSPRCLAALTVVLVLGCKKPPPSARSDDASPVVATSSTDAAVEADTLGAELAALEALAEAGTSVPLQGDVAIAAVRALEGELPADAKKVLQEARFRLRRCAPPRTVDAGKATVEVSLVVKEGGEVSKSAPYGDAGASALALCLAAALEPVRFESPDAGLAKILVRLEL